ncbi:E3 ubiquitin-protein ligase rnf13 [Homalodisca vitripennis]|nr:E3 ubiquitin-protein ligase rnf13 [Homalodisca vitripennis]
MSANNPQGIHVAAVFVSENTGLILKDRYLYNDGYYIIVDNDSPFDINTHLLFPFAIVVGICFCTMLGFMEKTIEASVLLKWHLRGGRQGQKSGPSVVSRDNCLGLFCADSIQPFIRAFLACIYRR